MSSSIKEKNIVVLGSSYAGLSTAHYLLRHVVPSLASPSSYTITVIAPSAHALCRPACPRAMLSDTFFSQEKLFVSISEQLNQYPSSAVRFIQGVASTVDTDARTVTVKKTDSSDDERPYESESIITFHAIIIATGASTPSPLLGFNASSRSNLEKHWSALRAALPAAKKIVIAGGGPTGIEIAGELGEYLNGRPGYFASKLQHPKVEITVICASPQILPLLRPALAAKAETMLSKVGVTVVKDVRVVSATPASSGTNLESVTTNAKVLLSDGTILDADLYIPATGTRANTSFLPHELLDSNNRVTTNPRTFRVNYQERIYSIGDCSSAFAKPSIHNILSSIPVLCANIKKDLLVAEGRGEGLEDRVFEEDLREMQLVPIGRAGGVGAAMGWALPGWLVWAIKGRDYWVWTTGRLWSGKQWAKEG